MDAGAERSGTVGTWLRSPAVAAAPQGGQLLVLAGEPRAVLPAERLVMPHDEQLAVLPGELALALGLSSFGLIGLLLVAGLATGGPLRLF